MSLRGLEMKKFLRLFAVFFFFALQMQNASGMKSFLKLFKKKKKEESSLLLDAAFLNPEIVDYSESKHRELEVQKIGGFLEGNYHFNPTTKKKVVKVDKFLAGYVIFCMMSGQDRKKKPCGFICYIKILEKFRGKGLGRKLLEFAINDCFKKGAQEILLFWDLDNKHADTLYKSIGFREKINVLFNPYVLSREDYKGYKKARKLMKRSSK